MPPSEIDKRSDRNSSEVFSEDKAMVLVEEMLRVSKALHAIKLKYYEEEEGILVRGEKEWNLYDKPLSTWLSDYTTAKQDKDVALANPASLNWWQLYFTATGKKERKKQRGYSENKSIRLAYLLTWEVLEGLGNGLAVKEDTVSTLKELLNNLQQSDYWWVRRDLVPVIESVVKQLEIVIPVNTSSSSSQATPSLSEEPKTSLVSPYALTQARLKESLCHLEEGYGNTKRGLLGRKGSNASRISTNTSTQESYIDGQPISAVKENLKWYDKLPGIIRWAFRLFGSYEKHRALITYQKTKEFLTTLINQPEALQDKAGLNKKEEALGKKLDKLSSQSELTSILQDIRSTLYELPLTEYVVSASTKAKEKTKEHTDSQQSGNNSSLSEKKAKEAEKEREDKQERKEIPARGQQGAQFPVSTTSSSPPKQTGSQHFSFASDSPVLSGNHSSTPSSSSTSTEIVISHVNNFGNTANSSESHVRTDEEIELKLECANFQKLSYLVALRYVEAVKKYVPEGLVEKASEFKKQGGRNIADFYSHHKEALETWRQAIINDEELNKLYEGWRKAYKKIAFQTHPDRGTHNVSRRMKETLIRDATEDRDYVEEGRQAIIEEFAISTAKPKKKKKEQPQSHLLIEYLFLPEEFEKNFIMEAQKTFRLQEETVAVIAGSLEERKTANKYRLGTKDFLENAKQHEEEKKQLRNEKQQIRKETEQLNKIADECAREKEEERRKRLKIERKLINFRLKMAFDEPIEKWDIYRVSREQDIDLLFNYKSVRRLGENEKPPTSVEPNKLVLQLKDDNLTIYWSLYNGLHKKTYEKIEKNSIQKILAALPEEESIQQDLVKEVLWLITKPNAIVMIKDSQSYNAYYICDYQVYKNEDGSYFKLTMQVTPEEENLLSTRRYVIKKIPFTQINENIYKEFVQKAARLGSETLFPDSNLNHSQREFDEEPVLEVKDSTSEGGKLTTFSTP